MSRYAHATILVIVLHAGCTAALDVEPSASTVAVSPTAPPTAPTTPLPQVTPAPNVQEGVTSEDGRFVGSWSSDPGVPPINVVHEWILHIETADGDAVEGALVVLNGDMPAHGHGMPTQPEVTADLGGGDYRVEGMSFQMGGYWVIDVTITAGGETDEIHFGLDL